MEIIFSDVFICGIEAHACIQCTVQDLIERNINAHVVIDAVSSGNQVNRFSAFRHMEKIGANLVTSGKFRDKVSVSYNL